MIQPLRSAVLVPTTGAFWPIATDGLRIIVLVADLQHHLGHTAESFRGIMSKTLRQLIILGCVVIGGAALLWY